MLQRLLLALLCSLLLATSALAGVRVRGYVRKDGTYVQPHYRTAPDSTVLNNYSYPGNFNPNTGTFTGGDPWRYGSGVPALPPVEPPVPPVDQHRVDLTMLCLKAYAPNLDAVARCEQRLGR